ncbi:MAG TPA: hypothetical protein PKD53_02630 [Chloroflexaceae bacterium]|nr:hypothetical protein [Chloroflexaceae bacterium]
MRFRTHLLSSLAAGLALYPRRPARLAALVAAGTLIDVDHLALYIMRTGDWSVVGALRYDRYRHRGMGAGDSRPRYGSLRSWLHKPLLALPLCWAAARSPRLWPLALGLALHLLLDYADWPAHHGERRRSGGRCRACGRGGRVTVQRSGRRGAYSYRALCWPCAERAARGQRPGERPHRGARRSPRSPGRPVVH